MGVLCVDESIHEQAGFIVSAVVYAEYDLSSSVFELIRSVGLTPGIDEFKSCILMQKNLKINNLRDKMWRLLSKTKLGLIVTPSWDRKSLGCEIYTGVKKIITKNNLMGIKHKVFVDQGINFKCRDVISRGSKFNDDCQVYFGQDSKQNGGIQLADLAASSFAVMLRQELGLLKKMVKCESYSLTNEISLSFELWARLRYNFFMGESISETEFDVSQCGLYISTSCDLALREATLKRFGTCYLGCIS